MSTEAELRAKAKDRRNKVRTLTIDLFPADKDIIDHLATVDRYASYIKQLIRKDMAAHDNNNNDRN